MFFCRCFPEFERKRDVRSMCKKKARLKRGAAKDELNENFSTNPLRPQHEITETDYNWVTHVAILGLRHQSQNFIALPHTKQQLKWLNRTDRTVCTACGQQMTIICRDPLFEKLTLQ